MILDIKKYPDEVLRKKSILIDNIDEEILTLLDNMAETMYKAPGVGLAAPQVGINKRAVVIDVSGANERTALLKLINPEIIRAEGEVVGEEGCLSLPLEYADVKRSEFVTAKYIDIDGNEKIIDADGLLARALQHEIDHLEGILFIDRLSPLKREFVKKRIKKRIANGDF